MDSSLTNEDSCVSANWAASTSGGRRRLRSWRVGCLDKPGSQTAKGQKNVLGAEHSEANALFREGLELYRAGKVGEALARWRQGRQLNPSNYLIRKQIWAVEHPERFYEGDVDYTWQKEQMARGL